MARPPPGSCRVGRPSVWGCQQATRRSAATRRAAGRRRGSARRHAGSGRRTHTPVGARAGSGGRPGMVASGRWRYGACRVPRPPAHGCRDGGAAVVDPSTPASSTMRPAYITSMRSHSSATAEMSWVMSTTRRSPSSRFTCCSRSSTWCCTVTSRAVVGSSATIRARAGPSAPCRSRPLPHAAGQLVRVLARSAARARGWRPRAAGRRRGRSRLGAAHAVVHLGRPRRAAGRRDMVGLNDVPGSWNTIANDVPSSRRRSPGRQVGEVAADEAQPGDRHLARGTTRAGRSRGR